MNSLTQKRILMGRLENGADLLDAFTNLCINNKVTMGRIEAIGAVKKAVVGFYDQTENKYVYHEFNDPHEIVSLKGNISLMNAIPMVHLHIMIANSSGEVKGGHLAMGTIVFACEFTIEEYQGPQLVRTVDPVTNLMLWND